MAGRVPPEAEEQLERLERLERSMQDHKQKNQACDQSAFGSFGGGGGECLLPERHQRLPLPVVCQLATADSLISSRRVKVKWEKHKQQQISG